MLIDPKSQNVKYSMWRDILWELKHKPGEWIGGLACMALLFGFFYLALQAG